MVHCTTHIPRRTVIDSFAIFHLGKQKRNMRQNLECSYYKLGIFSKDICKAAFCVVVASDFTAWHLFLRAWAPRACPAKQRDVCGRKNVRICNQLVEISNWRQSSGLIHTIGAFFVVGKRHRRRSTNQYKTHEAISIFPSMPLLSTVWTQ